MRLSAFSRKVLAGCTTAVVVFGTAACAQQLKPLHEPLLLTEQGAVPLPADLGGEALEDPELAYSPSIGGVEIINERFPTGEVRVQRQVKLDQDHNYVNHGPWKMFDRQGNVVASGGYDHGKRIGVWTRWHGRGSSKEMNAAPFNRFKAPFVSTVTFNNGVIDGLWLILDADEKKVRQISIANGKRHGATVTWLPNGEVLRQASYKEGKPVGEVLELKKAGGELQLLATYVDGRKVISKTTNYPRTKQRQSEQLYLATQTVQTRADSFWNLTFAEFEQSGDEVLHGPSRKWHSNGQLASQGEYRWGKKVGRFTYWHTNGQKRAEGLYRDDQHDGPWVWWHDNGLKSAFGSYTAGAEDGQWYWWQADGRLERRQLFDGTEVRAAAQPQEQQKR